MGLHHFKPVKPLGSGDTGRYHLHCIHLNLKSKLSLYLNDFTIFYWLQSVHLVELKGTGELYAMKAMEKTMMLNRNKVCDGE